MARKNMFDGIAPARETGPAGQMPEVFQASGPIAAIRQDLRKLGSRAVQEIDPGLIEDTGLRDRLGDLGADIASLRESIAAHGQQVPILLRPHPTLSGRYQVVYGRRRLAAVQGLGITVKALIRTLSDEEAVLAQGQENSLRKDPSFIEKTLFAGDLEAAGYRPAVIQDALNVTRSHTSHMRKVREAIPRELIERIGPAPAIGWKRWYDLASQILAAGLDAAALHPGPFRAGLDSDGRFAAFARAASQALARPAPGPAAAGTLVLGAAGQPLARVTLHKDRLSLDTREGDPGFAKWLHEDAQQLLTRLYDEYLAIRSQTDRA